MPFQEVVAFDSSIYRGLNVETVLFKHMGSKRGSDARTRIRELVYGVIIVWCLWVLIIVAYKI